MDTQSATEYRRLDEDDEAFHRHVRYAFRPSSGPWDEGSREELTERLAEGTVPRENRGLFVPGRDEPVTVAGWHDFRLRVRGEPHRVGGVSAVATPPEHRRRGYVRALLRAMLAEFDDEGVRFSALWPFKRSFYRELGWESCSAYAELSGPPAQFRSAGADAAGSFHRVDGSDWETLAPVRAAHGEGRALYMDRSADWWNHRVFGAWTGPDPYGVRWDGDDGVPRGYLVYRIEDGAGETGRTLRVADAAWADPEAYRHLLRFLGDHDSQVETVELHTTAAPTPPLLDLVEDPSAVTVERTVGPMFRLVDVPAALETLTYPPVTETVTLSVRDPLRERNEGRFELRVRDGRPDCRRVDGEADLSVGVGRLSELAVGYRDATTLAAAGQLTAPEPVLDRLDALFPSVPTFLGEFF